MKAIQPKITVISDPLARISSSLLDPHYSDERFLEAQTIFLKKGFEAPPGFCNIDTVDGALYRYSDRIVQSFSSEKTDKAFQAAEESGYDYYTAAYHEVYLQSLFETESLQLVHILSQIRWDNGYSLLAYGFILPDAVRPSQRKMKIRIIDQDPERLSDAKKLIAKVLDVVESSSGGEPKPGRYNADWLLYFYAYFKAQDNNPLGTIVSLKSELEAAYEAYHSKCAEVIRLQKTINELRQSIGESPSPYDAVLGGDKTTVKTNMRK